MINLNVPLNPTSFGQASFNLFLELVKLDDVALITIGDIALNCFDLTEEDGKIIQKAIDNGALKFKRDAPTFKLWHINGLRDAVGRAPHAMTFHETSALTQYEANTLDSLEGVFVSSSYTKKVFEKDLKNCKVIFCPLGFDSRSFKRIKLPEDDTIVFGLRGKFEKRKHTSKILHAWAKRFGGDPRYRLDCSIYNAFYSDEEQSGLIMSSFPNNEKPFNVNVLPNYTKNALYNQCLNAADIDLTGMSGCEGWNLPLFQSLCLGKHAIVLNAHVHKDFCNKENSILVEPSGMTPAEDGKFFISGSSINQGQWFDFDEDEFIEAMEKAVDIAKTTNEAGMKLAEEFTYERMAKTIYEQLIS